MAKTTNLKKNADVADPTEAFASALEMRATLSSGKLVFKPGDEGRFAAHLVAMPADVRRETVTSLVERDVISLDEAALDALEAAEADAAEAAEAASAAAKKAGPSAQKTAPDDDPAKAGDSGKTDEPAKTPAA